MQIKRNNIQYLKFHKDKRKGLYKMDELVESVLDYVRKPYTDHAIMINGEWGSGKTYIVCLLILLLS